MPALASIIRPGGRASGTVLITTRCNNPSFWGGARMFPLEGFDAAEGLRFLERRTKFGHGSQADQANLKEIARLLDGWPLLLEQAGSVLCSDRFENLADYVNELRQARALEGCLLLKANPFLGLPLNKAETPPPLWP